MTIRYSRWLIPVIHTPRKRVYYVNAAGNDNNNGRSVSNAWQTIAAVNAADLQPGDTVRFATDETFVGQILPMYHGREDMYINLSYYGDGARPIIDGSAANAMLIEDQDDASCIRCEYLDFSGSTVSNYGAVKCDTHHLYFYDCIFRDSAVGAGFESHDATGLWLHHITLDACLAHSNYASGISISSTADTYGPYVILIKNCVAHDNGLVGDYANHGIYIRYGGIVEGCTCYANENAGIKVNCQGLYDYPYDAPIVRNNYCYSNRTGIIVDNVNSKIYNNIVAGSTYYALNLSFDSEGSEIYFNTFINNTAGDGLIEVAGANLEGATLKNNIFVQDSAVYDKYILHAQAPGTLEYAATNNVYDYNIYYHTGSATHNIFYDTAGRNWATWQGYGAEAHGTQLTALPGFVTRYTDLHPADGGNLKALGVALAGYTTDKDGNARGTPPTPGAYEEAA